MKDLNDRLTELKYKINERERYKNQRQRLTELQRSLEVKKEELYNSLKKEEMDVKKLEGVSLTNFIHMLKGDKYYKLEQEKKEALTAKLKYDEACREVENISRDIKELEEKILSYGDLDREYGELIEVKERTIKAGQGYASQRLDSILEEKAVLMSREREIGEALEAGRNLLDALADVKKSLNSAESWGTWDMLGGGFLATAAKHSRIDEARSGIEKAQWLLNRFHSELADIGGSIEVDIGIGSFLTFADYFFDGIFADWAVQSKISDALQRVSDTIYNVETLLQKLKGEMEYTQRRIGKLEEEKVRIIEEA